MFTSPNVPEQHRWFYIDLPQMTAYIKPQLSKHDLEDRVVFERWELPDGGGSVGGDVTSSSSSMSNAEIGVQDGAEPLGREFGKLDVKNNHAEYAGVWFSLAGITYTALYISGKRKLSGFRKNLPLRR